MPTPTATPTDLRYSILHGDNSVWETVRDLPLYEARRLLEHEIAAGRVAVMRVESDILPSGRVAPALLADMRLLRDLG